MAIGYQPPPPIDFMGMLQAGQQYRMQKEQSRLLQLQRQAAERQSDQQRWMPQALADYAAGESTDLQRIAPGEFQQLEKGRADLAKARAAAAKELAEANRQTATTQQQETVRTSRALITAIDASLKNPAAYGQIRAGLLQANQQGAIKIDPTQIPEQMPPPEQLQQFREAQMVNLKTVSDPKFTDTMVEVAASGGWDLSDPKLLQDQRFQAAMKATIAQKHKGVTVNVGANGEKASPLTTQNTSKQQDELLGARQTMMMLDDIEEIARDPSSGKPNWGQFLGYLPQGKRWTLNTIDTIAPGSLSPEAQDELSRMNAFRTVVDKFKAEEFKRLAGTAQTASEVKNLANSILNADMSSTQFGAAYINLRRLTGRIIDTAESVLADGIPLGSTRYAAEMKRRLGPIGAEAQPKGIQLPEAPPAAPVAPPPQGAAPAGPPQAPVGAPPPQPQPGPAASAPPPEAPPPAPQVPQRREPPPETAPAPGGPSPVAQRLKGIVDQGFAAGKTPQQIVDEMVQAGLPPDQRQKALENLNKRWIQSRAADVVAGAPK